MSRILVIDDEKDMLEEVKSYFEVKGHEVLIAWEAREGLRLALESNPDLVILDIKMPGKSGMEILKEAKAQNPQLRVIMLTGHYQDELTESRAFSLGASVYLKKPVGITELENAITEVLSKK